MAERKQITLTLPTELVDSLDLAARDRCVGRNLLIETLLTQGLRLGNDRVPFGRHRRGPQRRRTNMSECGGSHPTYECDRYVFWINPSGHAFCREHAIMHEAQLAGGFARRIAEAGDAYLVGAVVEAVANLTAFVDRWPDHDRMTDR